MRITFFILFSSSSRGRVISRPHPTHIILTSEPHLATVNSDEPHGCFFFRISRSWTLIFTIIFRLRKEDLYALLICELSVIQVGAFVSNLRILLYSAAKYHVFSFKRPLIYHWYHYRVTCSAFYCQPWRYRAFFPNLLSQDLCFFLQGRRWGKLWDKKEWKVPRVR